MSANVKIFKDTEKSSAPAIYAAMHSMQSDLAQMGLRKTEQHTQFKYRGIDGALGVMAQVLAKNKVALLPTLVETTHTQFSNAKGGKTFGIVANVDYQFVAITDGSSVTVRYEGFGLDQGDKALNKAMSSAYKLMVFNTFSLPIEPIDVEKDDHQIVDAPPVPKYTEEEYKKWHDAVDSLHQWDLYALWQTLSTDAKVDLANSFQHGKKVAKKEAVKEMLANCREELEAAQIEHKKAMEAGDIHASIEILPDVPPEYLLEKADSELHAWLVEAIGNGD